jgi:hypothetical protein
MDGDEGFSCGLAACGTMPQFEHCQSHEHHTQHRPGARLGHGGVGAAFAGLSNSMVTLNAGVVDPVSVAPSTNVTPEKSHWIGPADAQTEQALRARNKKDFSVTWK